MLEVPALVELEDEELPEVEEAGALLLEEPPFGLEL
jgi:hypothetical protein